MGVLGVLGVPDLLSCRSTSFFIVSQRFTHRWIRTLSLVLGLRVFYTKDFHVLGGLFMIQNWYVPSQHQQNHSTYLKHLISMSDKQTLKYEICITMFVCHRHHYTKSCDDILLQLYVPMVSTPSPNLLSWISCSSINNWALFNPSYICSMVRPSIDVNANRWQLSTN